MGNKIKVVMAVDNMRVNGISTVIMNYCKNLDKDRFEVSVLAGQPVEPGYVEQSREYGFSIVTLPSRKKEALSYLKAYSAALGRLQPDIVHIHCNSASVTPELLLAKGRGVKIRIAHSHNTTCMHQKMHRAMYPLFRRLYTHGFACGTEAGRWLFRDRAFTVIPNGFKTRDFLFSEPDRREVRAKLHWDEAFVIGHIGRFNSQKNQPYLLRVFDEVAKRRADAVLLLVGSGPDFAAVQRLVEEDSFRDRIVLYGNSDRPAAMYSAMDVFALPSQYEGLPVVLLEAQISGLPCVVSDRVTREVDFGDTAWESIEADPEAWAQTILRMKPRTPEERRGYAAAHQGGIAAYDIANTVKQLEDAYTQLARP